VKEVLEEALAGGAPVGDDLGKPASGWLDIWYRSPSLTVLNAVWPPQISLFPHDHRMWAAIGIYGGQEDNTYYRRKDRQIVASGGTELRPGQVLLLGDDVIHAVRNPLGRYTGAIHVYGGDFVAVERSQWDPASLVEEPYDLEKVRAVFDEAQRAFEASAPSAPPAVS
jgi:predicted metal-dependent enzyme (double-stranded beta helix superfamily)